MIKPGLLCLALLLMPHLVQQAAEQLDMAEVLDTDGKRTDAVQRSRGPAERESVRWTVVVASYPERAVADTTAAQYHARLESMGYPVAVIADDAQGTATYRVIVGRYQRLAAAQAGLEALAGEIPAAAWLLNVRTAIPDEAWLPNSQAATRILPPDVPEARVQAQPALEASPAIEKPSLPEEEPGAEALPVVETPSIVETEPVVEAQPVLEASSDIEHEPVRWTVVIASYAERALADAAAGRYRARLAPVAVAVLAEDTQGGATYRVAVGRYQRLAAAQAGLDALAADMRSAAWLLNVQTPIPEEAWLPHRQPVADNAPQDAPEAPDPAPPAVETPSITKENRVLAAKPSAQSPEAVPVRQDTARLQRPVAVSTLPVQSVLVESPDLFYREHRHWAIVVASYAESAVADAAATRYRDQFEPRGYPVAVIAEEEQGIVTYQVVVGEFPHLAAAEAGMEALSGEIPDGSWLFNVQADVPDKAWLLYVQAVTGRPYPRIAGLRGQPLPVLDPSPAEEPTTEEEPQTHRGDDMTAAVRVSSTVVQGPAQVNQEPARWTVVLASYAERAIADTAAVRFQSWLQSQGEPVAVIAREAQEAATYRVIAGRYQHLEAAQTGLEALPGEIRQEAWLLNVQTTIPEEASLSAKQLLAVSETPDAIEDEKELSTIKKEVSAVEEELSVVEETPLVDTPAVDHGPMRWTVVVGSHPERAVADEKAAAYRSRMASTGYQVAVLSGEVDGAVTYRVAVGRFKRLAAAQAGLQAMGDKAPNDAWLLHNQTPIPVIASSPSPQSSASRASSQKVQRRDETPPTAEEPPAIKVESVEEAEPVVEADAGVEAEQAAEASSDIDAPVVPVDPEPMRWTVVVASYPERAAAETSAAEYRTRLESAGYPVVVIAEGSTYRVVAGRFKRLATAQAGQQAMGEAIPQSTWLLYVQP